MFLRRYVFPAACMIICGLPAGAAGKLQIEEARVAQFEDGPTPPANFQFEPGETVYFSFLLTGYQVKETDDEARSIQLHYRIEVRDPYGVLAEEPKTSKLATGLSREDRHWDPKVRDAITVPAFAAGGVYRITVEAVDELSGSRSVLDTPFHVGGLAADPAAALAIRNFRFLRQQEDGQGLVAPAYRPGDTLWARFDIAGFKLGDKNRVDVDYGLRVLRPSGEELYSLPVAVSEKVESFYPHRWAPGELSLRVDANLKPAHYTLVVTAHDRVGGGSVEVREGFDVER
ncbi:MAG: hypothetical protein ABI165_02045 [Bryobacteraceae bacterium]